MTRMIFLLDGGHGSKGDRFDPGYVRADGRREVDLVRTYLGVAATRLTELDHVVYLLGEGAYSKRHEYAGKLAARHPELKGIYVQCHGNSGGGTYGLVRPLYNSNRGKQTANYLSKELLTLTGVSKVRVDELYPNAATAKNHGKKPRIREDGTEDWDWWTRGWECIDGIYSIPNVCSVVYEPAFLDAPAHNHLWSSAGLVLIGEALARGLRACVPPAEAGIGATSDLKAKV